MELPSSYHGKWKVRKAPFTRNYLQLPEKLSVLFSSSQIRVGVNDSIELKDGDKCVSVGFDIVE